MGGDQAARDEDYLWHHDWGADVPSRARFQLDYPQTVLQLPLDPNDERKGLFDTLLPDLFADLT